MKKPSVEKKKVTLTQLAADEADRLRAPLRARTALRAGVFAKGSATDTGN